jgi:hypothetical protein
VLCNALTAYLRCASQCSAVDSEHHSAWQPSKSSGYLVDHKRLLAVDTELQTFLRSVHTAAQQICGREQAFFDLFPSIWECLDSLVFQAGICKLQNRDAQVRLPSTINSSMRRKDNSINPAELMVVADII